MTRPQHHDGREERARKRRQDQKLLRAGIGSVTAIGLILLGVIAWVTISGGDATPTGHPAPPTATDQQAQWSADPYTGGARLAVDKTSIDEGSVPYMQQVDAVYKLKNVGDQPLTLGKPKVSVKEGC